MIICAAGDIHGAMDRLYQDVLVFETLLGVRFDYVLHVGDFGIWADPNRIDKATRHHDGVGDFPAWLRENRGRRGRPFLSRVIMRTLCGLRHVKMSKCFPASPICAMDARSISKVWMWAPSA
jgi:hypothetical protein